MQDEVPKEVAFIGIIAVAIDGFAGEKAGIMPKFVFNIDKAGIKFVRAYLFSIIEVKVCFVGALVDVIHGWERVKAGKNRESVFMGCCRGFWWVGGMWIPGRGQKAFLGAFKAFYGGESGRGGGFVCGCGVKSAMREAISAAKLRQDSRTAGDMAAAGVSAGGI